MGVDKTPAMFEFFAMKVREQLRCFAGCRIIGPAPFN